MLGSKVLLLPNMFMVLMNILVQMINSVDVIDQVESRDNVWEACLLGLACCRLVVAPHVIWSA